MGNKHRSAQGKIIDMSVIAAMNEKTRAVGNMKVNARGDEVDSMNRIVKPRGQRIQENRQSASASMQPAPTNFSGLAVDTVNTVNTIPEEPIKLVPEETEELTTEELTSAEIELQKELNEEQVPAKPTTTKSVAKPATTDDKKSV